MTLSKNEAKRRAKTPSTGSVETHQARFLFQRKGEKGEAGELQQESPSKSLPDSSLPVPDETPASTEELIDAMNSLHAKVIACDSSLKLDLPQIAVVGAQSAGKSSVLENIVGKPFLPRGKGVVTRRPILIQLTPFREEYVVFGHQPGKKLTDFTAVQKEILDQMPVSDGNGKVFSSEPIQLKIFSPKVLKLTLLDLPGLVRVAVDGNSPDSVAEVREMVLRYISNPECIILAVSPANQDLATSDALEIAKVVDPERERTIGVITKIDRLEAYTDIKKVLENREIQLKRGYIGVVNRSQQDIDEGKDFDYILEKERKIFSQEPAFKDMVHRMGTPYLRIFLQKTLRAHIRKALPDIRTKIAEKHYQVNQQLDELNERLGGNDKSREFYVLRLVSEFVEDFDVAIMGNSELVKIDTISAGALIYYKLHTEVVSYLKFPSVIKPEDLILLINSLHGLRCSLTFPSLALDCINRKMVSEYEYPLQKCVDSIRKVLEDAVIQSSLLMDGYPSMKNEILYRIQEKIKESAVNTFGRLRDHVHAEMHYVNLEHPDLDLSVCQSLVPVTCPPSTWKLNNVEEIEFEKIQLNSSKEFFMDMLTRNESMQEKVRFLMVVMTKYLEIVQKQIIDVAVKYIVSFLIKKVLDFMKKDLVPSLFGSPNLKSFTEDCEQDFRIKEELENVSATLVDALDTIQNF